MPEHSEFDDKATLEDVMEIQLPSYKVKLNTGIGEIK
jgi:hypothetical protein